MNILHFYGNGEGFFQKVYVQPETKTIFNLSALKPILVELQATDETVPDQHPATRLEETANQIFFDG